MNSYRAFWMGFDLTAEDKSLGEERYFRAGVYQIILLRTSMKAAG